MSKQTRDKLNADADEVVRAVNQNDPVQWDPSISKAGGVTQADNHSITPGHLAGHYPEYRQNAPAPSKAPDKQGG